MEIQDVKESPVKIYLDSPIKSQLDSPIKVQQDKNINLTEAKVHQNGDQITKNKDQ